MKKKSSLAVIGPSHAKHIEAAKEKGQLPAAEGIHVKGFHGAPIFSQYIVDEIASCADFDRIFLYVAGSIRFNMLHDRMRAGRFMVSRELHDAISNTTPSLFEGALMKDERVVQVVDAHRQRWLDHFSETFPNIKFVFWCDFSSKVRGTAKRTISRECYDSLMEKNSNAVDLHDFVKKVGVDDATKLLLQDGLHANAKGRRLFVDYLLQQAR